uniref:Uncharacterized protein n=1 Tax=Anguilla anguilla TaxID=7936 RepID=A0A0E9T9T3_ANGAN
MARVRKTGRHDGATEGNRASQLDQGNVIADSVGIPLRMDNDLRRADSHGTWLIADLQVVLAQVDF